MFCPRCSQKQVSDEVRFCKGCGFPLIDVAEALKNNGLVNRNVIPVTKDLKKNATKGLAVMTLSGVFFILSLIFGTPEPSLFVQFNLLVGILCYLFGLIWIAYSFWRTSKETPKYIDEKGRHLDFDESYNLAEHRQESAFQLSEPDMSQFADANMLPVKDLKTNEFVEQPSNVTEGTTKLLEK